jgi:hypothetical protein
MQLQCAPDFAPVLDVGTSGENALAPETGSLQQFAANEESVPL